MTTSEPERTYGQSTDWKPEAPRLRLFPLIVAWLATGVALMVAAWVLPGVDIRNSSRRCSPRCACPLPWCSASSSY